MCTVIGECFSLCFCFQMALHMRGNGRKVCTKQRNFMFLYYPGVISEWGCLVIPSLVHLYCLVYSKLVTLTGLDIERIHRLTHVDSFIDASTLQVEKLHPLFLDKWYHFPVTDPKTMVGLMVFAVGIE